MLKTCLVLLVATTIATSYRRNHHSSIPPHMKWKISTNNDLPINQEAQQCDAVKFKQCNLDLIKRITHKPIKSVTDFMKAVAKFEKMHRGVFGFDLLCDIHHNYTNILGASNVNSCFKLGFLTGAGGFSQVDAFIIMEAFAIGEYECSSAAKPIIDRNYQCLKTATKREAPAIKECVNRFQRRIHAAQTKQQICGASQAYAVCVNKPYKKDCPTTQSLVCNVARVAFHALLPYCHINCQSFA